MVRNPCLAPTFQLENGAVPLAYFKSYRVDDDFRDFLNLYGFETESDDPSWCAQVLAASFRLEAGAQPDACMPGVVAQCWREDGSPRGLELLEYLRLLFPHEIPERTLRKLEIDDYQALWIANGLKAFDEVLKQKHEAARKEYHRVSYMAKTSKTIVTIKPNDSTENPLTPRWFTRTEASLIPKREWLYGDHYIRKFVSATFAPGGVGKSSLVMAEAFAMASELALLGIRPPSNLRVWYFNLEDPLEELQRRLKAIEIFYGVDESNPIYAEKRLAVHGRETELVIAQQNKGEAIVAAPIYDALKRAIDLYAIDVVIIDPFVSSHRVSENDNVQIDMVAKTWSRLADETRCAVELVHHVRKTNGAEATVEDGRGASALLAAVRSARVLNVMSQDEADRVGVALRRTHFRVENGKPSMTKPVETATWYQMVSQRLPNGTGGILDDGDDVGVCTPWAWPDLHDGMTVHDLRKAQVAIAAHECRESDQSFDWAGHWIGDALALDTRSNKADKRKVKHWLRIWTANGMFEIIERKDEKSRKSLKFVVVGEPADD